MESKRVVPNSEPPKPPQPQRQQELLEQVHGKVSEIAEGLEKKQIAEYLQLMNDPKRLLWLNFISGSARGVGIAFGITVFTTGLVYMLKGLGALDLPIIGGFIADLVDQVQHQMGRY
ncbi:MULTISPECIES: DUF5665 domain-containing protein [Paenibacillus]|uniref:DUF5665 domain-containing protein n=1 Tax=Paenibacillus TaxID=44249 RepID=UPI0022B8E82E|nr:DUF5665 domain-containing protein [Paenibacillus caseinilyticus]MCZ8518793.1 DUF5665 domain-containing protein [Paenibacillus caseinilyticus]